MLIFLYIYIYDISIKSNYDIFHEIDIFIDNLVHYP